MICLSLVLFNSENIPIRPRKLFKILMRKIMELYLHNPSLLMVEIFLQKGYVKTFQDLKFKNYLFIIYWTILRPEAEIIFL